MTTSQIHAVPDALPRSRPLRKRNRSSGPHVVLIRTAVVTGALLLWELLARFGIVNALFVSKPTSITLASLTLLGSDVARTAVAETISSLTSAFLLGTASGIIVGTILGLQRLLHRAYMPIVLML